MVAYETVSHDELYRRLNEELVSFALPRRCRAVVDLGCGTGSLSEILLGCLSPSPLIWAIDPDPAMIAASKQRLGQHIGVQEGSAEDFADRFPPMSVDAVLVGNAIHLVEDLELAFRGVGRVLVAGGTVAFNTAFHTTATDAKGAALARAIVFEANKLVRRRYPEFERRVGVRPAAKRALSKELYRELLEAEGFSNVTFVERTYTLPPALVLNIISTPVFARGAFPDVPLAEAVDVLRAAGEVVLGSQNRLSEDGGVARTWLYGKGIRNGE